MAKPTPDIRALRGSIASSPERLARLHDRLRTAPTTALQLLWGPSVHAVRSAQAWNRLAGTDLAPEADPLARVALEHAISAQWCHFHDQDLRQLAADVEHHFRSYFGRAADWQNLDQIREALAERPIGTTGPPLPNFGRGRLGALDVDHTLELQYATLSRSVHLTDQTVLSYLAVVDGDPSAPLTLRDTPQHVSGWPGAYAAATATMLALGLLADLAGDQPLLDDLDADSDALNLVLFLDDDRTDQQRAARARRGS